MENLLITTPENLVLGEIRPWSPGSLKIQLVSICST